MEMQSTAVNECYFEPPSTGHLFALVRQIVDIVCKLLTIVDAVMGALPPAGRGILRLRQK